ncbi:MAG: glycosyltransferase [Solirubrobacterales bacterium]
MRRSSLWTATTILDRAVKVARLSYARHRAGLRPGAEHHVTGPSRKAQPPELISVVVPVLNGEDHVLEQLTALASQTYAGAWELVVVDNGCTDRTMEIVRDRADGQPAVRIVEARGKRGLNHARNAGAAAADGDFLAFCDADDVATPSWLAAMAEAARHADLVGGRNEWEALNEPMVVAWRPSAPMTDLMRAHGWLRYAPGGNLGVWTAVAREIGWDERFSFGSTDQIFSWQAQLAGYRLAFAPDAVMQLRFRHSIGATARQFYRYGRSGPELHRAFRDSGIPRPDNGHALQVWKRLIVGLPDLWISRERRGRWVRQAAYRFGRLVGSARTRTLVL